MGIDIEGAPQGRGLDSSSLWFEDLCPLNSSAGEICRYFTEVSGMVGVKCPWLNDAFHCSVAMCW